MNVIHCALGFWVSLIVVSVIFLLGMLAELVGLASGREKWSRVDAIIVLICVVVVSTPLFLEGTLLEKVVFDRDGQVLGTIKPSIMTQREYDRLVHNKILVVETELTSSSSFAFNVNTNTSVEVECYWVLGTTNSARRMAGEAIRSGQTKIGYKTIGWLITHNATNEIATARSKLAGQSNLTKLKGRSTTTLVVLESFRPVFDRYNVEPINVRVVHWN